MDIRSVVKIEPKIKIPELNAGDTVKVSFKTREGEKERTQNFQGVVISVRGGGIDCTVTVRKVAHGVGVERTFFLCSPVLENIEVIRRGVARRAKLYYLRGLSGKASRIKEKSRAKLPAELKQAVAAEEQPAAEAPVAVAAEASTAPEAKVAAPAENQAAAKAPKAPKAPKEA